jgi:hypothetical protein
LKFTRIFDRDHAVRRFRHLSEQRVDERGLACRRPAGDKHVSALLYGEPKESRLIGLNGSGGDIIVEREDRDRRLADREGRRRDDRGKQAFETLAVSGNSAETRGLPE